MAKSLGIIHRAINKINRAIAINMTLAMGSIWAFYCFILFGLGPVVFPASEPQLLYWSNFIQLIFLPVIMVGQNVLGQADRDRALKDHESLEELVKGVTKVITSKKQ